MKYFVIIMEGQIDLLLRTCRLQTCEQLLLVSLKNLLLSPRVYVFKYLVL